MILFEHLFNSIESGASLDIERKFKRFVQEHDWEQFLKSQLSNIDFHKSVKYDGITLYEDRNWRLYLAIEGAHSTAQGIAITFPRDTYIAVLSDFEYSFAKYEITEEEKLAAPITTRSSKYISLLKSYCAYEFFNDRKEVTLLKLEEKSDAAPIARYFKTSDMSEAGLFFVNQFFDRASLFMSAIEPLKTESVESYVELTKHPVDNIRWQALLHLFKVEHNLAKEILVSFLDDSSRAIRQQANETYVQLMDFERKKSEVL